MKRETQQQKWRIFKTSSDPTIKPYIRENLKIWMKWMVSRKIPHIKVKSRAGKLSNHAHIA